MFSMPGVLDCCRAAANSLVLCLAVPFKLLPLVLARPLVLDTNLELSCSFTGENGGSEPESGGESGKLREDDATTIVAFVAPFATEYVVKYASGDTELGTVTIAKLLTSSTGLRAELVTFAIPLVISTVLVLPFAPFSNALANCELAPTNVPLASFVRLS